MLRITLAILYLTLAGILSSTASQKPLEDTLKKVHQHDSSRIPTSSNQSAVYLIPSEKDSDSFGIKAIPWILALLSSSLAWYVLRREGRYKHLAFLSEIDKMLISNPALWDIYDNNDNKHLSSITVEGPTNLIIKGKETLSIQGECTLTIQNLNTLKPLIIDDNQINSNRTTITINKKQTVTIDGEASVKIENSRTTSKLLVYSAADRDLEGELNGFCYYKLNNFEYVFKHLSPYSSSLTIWENYMVHLMANSTRFSNIANREAYRYVYSERFKNKLIQLNNFATEVKTIPRSYKNSDIDNSAGQNFFREYNKQVATTLAKLRRAETLKKIKTLVSLPELLLLLTIIMIHAVFGNSTFDLHLQDTYYVFGGDSWYSNPILLMLDLILLISWMFHQTLRKHPLLHKTWRWVQVAISIASIIAIIYTKEYLLLSADNSTMHTPPYSRWENFYLYGRTLTIAAISFLLTQLLFWIAGLMLLIFYRKN